MGKKFFRKHILVFISGAGVFLLAVLFFSVFGRERFTIDVFDIGQGDAMLITTPSGERVLVDGGPDASVVAKLSRRLGLFNRTIDLLVATHPQADHITGFLSVLDHFTVRRAMLTTIKNETPEYRSLRAKFEEKDIPIIDPGELASLAIGEGGEVTIDMLWPSRSYSGRRMDDPNDISTMFMLSYGDHRFLFTGDSTTVVEEALLRESADLHADVLKVGHHGSDTSTTPQFLAAVAPSIAVISVGEKNRFGHPSRRVLRRLERAGAAIYRTDLHGDVRVTSDGKTLRVKTKR